MKAYSKALSQLTGASKEVIESVLDEYLKLALTEIVFTGSVDTPFGTMTLIDNRLQVVRQSKLVQSLLDPAILPQDVETMIATIVESRE